MRFFKYFRPLMLFIFYEIFWIVFAYVFNYFFSSILSFNLSIFMPTKYILTELLLHFTIFIPLGGLIGYLIGGFLLAPGFLYIHKRFFGKELKYGIQIKPPAETIKILMKGFFPLMLALNIAYTMASDAVVNFVVSPDAINILTSSTLLEAQSLISPLGLFILLPISFGASMILFSSVWVLKNSGIIYSNEHKVRDITEPFVIRSVGGWFHTLLKGYAGVGVIVTYFSIITTIIQKIVNVIDTGVLIIVIVMWSIVLLILFLAIIPTLIVNESFRDKTANYIRKYAKKLGITQPATISFDYPEKEDDYDAGYKEDMMREPQEEISEHDLDPEDVIESPEFPTDDSFVEAEPEFNDNYVDKDDDDENDFGSK